MFFFTFVRLNTFLFIIFEKFLLGLQLFYGWFIQDKKKNTLKTPALATSLPSLVCRKVLGTTTSPPANTELHIPKVLLKISMLIQTLISIN